MTPGTLTEHTSAQILAYLNQRHDASNFLFYDVSSADAPVPHTARFPMLITHIFTGQEVPPLATLVLIVNEMKNWLSQGQESQEDKRVLVLPENPLSQLVLSCLISTLHDCFDSSEQCNSVL